MSRQPTLLDIPSATSSPESAFGATPSGSRDGRTTGPSGPAAPPVSPLARREGERVFPTPVISGPSGTGLFENADLSQLLASRLQAKLASSGSTLFRLTWKRRVTPSGRLIFALQASVPRTSGSGCTGWPTPTANSSTGPGTLGRDGGMNLQTAAELTGWPTPAARDWKGVPDTPPTHNSRPLNEVAALVRSPGRADGGTLNGSAAGMEKRGLLNPAHSRWLMGLPPVWDDCAVMAMRSLRRKPRRLSKR